MRFSVSSYDFRDIFDDNGLIRDQVFDYLVSHLNRKSDPGYPYSFVSNNGQLIDVYKDLLQRDFSDWLHLVIDTEFEGTLDASERLELFSKGVVPLARIFVKGEPTKRSKVARLIFGVPVWMNMLGRLILYELLDDAKMNWRTNFHKVGMDLYTDDGIKDVYQCLSDIASTTVDQSDLLAVSDDIQGWEYQVRSWMHQTFHEEMGVYYERCGASVNRLLLMKKYFLIEKSMLCHDSQGFVHSPNYYFQFSGKLTTHLENSMLRAALAYMDYPSAHFKAATNGDDCICTQTQEHISGFIPSEAIGFVHTDVEPQIGIFHFCSQLIYRDEENRVIRVPDGYAKLLANFLLSGSVESDQGILSMLPNDVARDFVSLRSVLRAE